MKKLFYRFKVGEIVYYDNKPYTVIKCVGFMFPAYRITDGTINYTVDEFMLKTKPEVK